MNKLSIITAALVIWLTTISGVQATPLKIYVDADRTGSRESGIAIEQGIRTALSEVGNQVLDRPIELIIKDHRGSSPRSERHIRQFLADPDAIAVFAGLHSPPLLAQRDQINEQKALVMVPWAAAGPITRGKSEENWIFRLSVDDTKAGSVIARAAVQNEGYKRPYLLLEDTGWGKSNQRNMTSALVAMGTEPLGVEWFNWSLSENTARILLRKIKQAGADVIFLVANSPEGKSIARAMASLPKEERLPIRSHWGITGGDFAQEISVETRSRLDLKFIQTRYSFINDADDAYGQKVLQTASQVFPGRIRSGKDIDAPTGFIHSYDLTRILLQAIRQAGLSGDIKVDRNAVRRALENLQQPVRGLIKTYQQPFAVYTPDQPDAHEALSSEDYVMGHFLPDNTIMLER